jgi:HK97 family phage portal protein
MRLLTRARYAVAVLLGKSMQWQYMPTWVARTALSGAFQGLVNQGYKRAAAYFACVEAHAFTFPEPPLWVWDGEDDNARPIPNHPIRKLMLRPNVDQDEVAFKAQVITWAAIGGNCYIYKLRNRSRQVIGLRPYHDGVFRAVPVDDADGLDDNSGTWVSHYMFRQTNGEEIPVDKADVIHFQWPSVDPHAPWKAQPPILAAAYDIDAVNEATRFVGALLANDAIPRTVITQSAEQALTGPERQRMRAEWATMHGGDNRGGVAILEAGATIQRLGLSASELDFSALHDMPERHICAVMKVPSPVAGLGEDPTYANSEEASARFTTDTRVPLWRRFESAIQSGLAADFGNGVSVRHFLGRVAALQEDAAARANRIYGGYDRGLIGFYESRAQLGITTDPDPRDLFVVQISRDLVPFAQVLVAPAQIIDGQATPPKALPAPDAKAHDAKAAAARTARALQRVRAAAAKKMEPRISAFFEGLAETVVARAEDVGKARAEKRLPLAAQLLLPADGLELGGIFRLFTLEVLKASWETWNGAIDVELAFDESDPAVVAALAQAGDRIGGITDTTLTAVRELLQYGAEQGWSVDQLVRGDDTRPGLRATVAQSYAGRARNIARTELGTAQNVATHQRYTDAGVDQVQILDGGSEDSDDACNQLNGTIQTLAWFKANPLQHPNCVRCAAPHFGD